MRISFVLPFINWSGGVRTVFEYAHRLQQRGHRLAIYFPLFPSRRLGDLRRQSDVTLLGLVRADDLPTLYSAVEVFAYPSLYEGFEQSRRFTWEDTARQTLECYRTICGGGL